VAFVAGGAVVDIAEFELVLEPHHPSLDYHRFGSHVLDLTNALKLEIGGVTTCTAPEPGKRGGLPEIMLALGTSGAIAAAVVVFRAWLDKDKARQIGIKVRTKGKSRVVEITANAANVADLEKLLVAASVE
jgi:hypothetical protein